MHDGARNSYLYFNTFGGGEALNLSGRPKATLHTLPKLESAATVYSSGSGWEQNPPAALAPAPRKMFQRLRLPVSDFIPHSKYYI